MKANNNEFYDDNFYAKHIEGMATSAEIVLGLLYQYYKPLSVIDMGWSRGMVGSSRISWG